MGTGQQRPQTGSPRRQGPFGRIRGEDSSPIAFSDASEVQPSAIFSARRDDLARGIGRQVRPACNKSMGRSNSFASPQKEFWQASRLGEYIGAAVESLGRSSTSVMSLQYFEEKRRVRHPPSARARTLP